MPQRERFVRDWLACQRDGGRDDDEDGFLWCDDCNDADADTFPGAPERCNGLDDDCDRQVDSLDCCTELPGDDGATFLLCTGVRTWEESLEECRRRGGTLAVPRDETEQDWMARAVRDTSQTDWWIGANDRDLEGRFVDADGTPLGDERWAEGQPDEDTEGNCVVLSFFEEGRWNDRSCDFVYPAICRL